VNELHLEGRRRATHVTKRAARTALFSILTTFFAVSVTVAAAPAPAAQQETPWPVTLGLRVAAVEKKIAVMDRVVLVPDEATFVDEISRWTLDAQWPVLIEDDRWTPLFVRGFKPAQVVRRTDRAAPLPTDGKARRRLIEAAVTRVWGGDPEKGTPAGAFAAVGYLPPGVVVTSMEDPAWPAALALAAGRGQLLAYIDVGLNLQPSETLNAAQFERLATAVTDIFRATNYKFAALGDQLETCTFCRTIPAKCTPNLPLHQRFAAPGAPPTDPNEPIAVTDALCRNANGSRYAFCGAIWGPSPRAAYAAMCSLFLPRRDLTFISAYGETGNFSQFAVGVIQQTFEEAGYKIRPMIGASATLRAWQRWAMGGVTPDVLFVNSSGDPVTFHLGVPGETPVENQGSSLDIPLLTRPLALSMVHSFSLAYPSLDSTLGGRWIDHGVYAYVGSVQEPFLSAFVPPRSVMDRLVNFVPFLIAARHWEGPFAVPWRIATFGDPLMLASPPKQAFRTRLGADAPEPAKASGGTRTLASVRDSAVELLRACQSDPTPANFNAAFRELEKLGDDSIAVNLWAIAAQRGMHEGCARAALGALFRAQDLGAVAEAFKGIPDPDQEALDMLWSLATPRLQSIDSPELVDLLASHPRRMRLDVDLIRLAPAMSRLRSRNAARAMLLDATHQTKDAAAQEALRAAAGTY